MPAEQDAADSAARLSPDQTPAASSDADLTESMMHIYGHRLPLEVIARLVHEVLDSAAHPAGAPVPRSLGRQVVRRLRAHINASDPASRPPRSERTQAIARALEGRRG